MLRSGGDTLSLRQYLIKLHYLFKYKLGRGKRLEWEVTMGLTADFEIIDGVLVKYHGNDSDVIIPEGVCEIGEFAFQENTNICSVVIGDGVTSIGLLAFHGCKRLSSLVILAH